MEKQIEHIDNLNEEIKSSLISYTDGYGYDINKMLRMGIINNIIKNIDEAFIGVPITDNPILLYRTIDNNFNLTYRSEGYISTSTTLTTAGTDGNCCILKITVPSGSRILPLKIISVNPNEDEVLLNRNSSLQFISEYQETIKGDIYNIINMVYLPSEQSVNIKYISQRNEEGLKIINEIYSPSFIGDFFQESSDLGETFEEALVSLKIDINHTVKRLELINGIGDIFYDMLELDDYQY